MITGIRTAADQRLGVILQLMRQRSPTTPGIQLFLTAVEGTTLPSTRDHLRIALALREANVDPLRWLESCARSILMDRTGRITQREWEGSLASCSAEKIAHILTESGSFEEEMRGWAQSYWRAKLERSFEERDLEGACAFVTLHLPQSVEYCEQFLKGRVQSIPPNHSLNVDRLRRWWPRNVGDQDRFGALVRTKKDQVTMLPVNWWSSSR